MQEKKTFKESFYLFSGGQREEGEEKRKKKKKGKKGSSLIQYTVRQGPRRALGADLIHLPPSPEWQAKEGDSDASRACLGKQNQPQVTKLLLIFC